MFFYISKYVTKWIGPPLFRKGLSLRNKLAPVSGVGTTTANNNYWLDMACMVPYSQKLLSLAIYDESRRKTSEFRKEYHREQESKQQGVSSSNSSSQQEAMMAMTMMMDPKAVRRLSEIRLNVLDEYLRPSLISNNLWSDIEDNWRYNNRIVAWARKEFLISKYGPYIQEALVAYPQLRNSPQLSSGGAGGDKRKFLLDLVHRGEINTDNITGDAASTQKSPFLQLPSTETILDAFRMKKWSIEKDMGRLKESLVPVAKSFGGTIVQQKQQPSSKNGNTMTQHIEVPRQTNVGSTDLEDLLEVVTKGYVKNCGPLNALCQEANFYQFYSKEYVQRLGDYLLKRTAPRRSASTRQSPSTDSSSDQDFLEERPSMSPLTVVLDIGAGDGLLMHCLKDYMERKTMGLPLSDSKKGNQKRSNQRKNDIKNNIQQPLVIPTMVATDDMSWRIFTKAKVEKLSVIQALDKYTASTTARDDGNDGVAEQRPEVIVICSWMPMGQDWTALFRKAQVDEYILIGEADNGSCGDNWLTWGNPDFYESPTNDNDNNDVDVDTRTPPYESEGYQRVDMDALTKFQFSSFDLANSKSSKTVSFRRRKLL